ncbi:MAG: preprotein translocase subunit SecG [Deltaproteobacteria bacterium]|nr:preprotein translocase subunit SecG [Deltaproteobacteria bacterium]
MFNILLVIHCLLCIFLVGLVLLQQGKGADMGAAFGGNSTTLFGAAGATDFVTKLTTGIAIAFMVTSILLVRGYTQFATSPNAVENPLEGSVMGQAAPAAESAVTVPEVPAPQPEPATGGEAGAEAAQPAGEPAAPSGEDNGGAK